MTPEATLADRILQRLKNVSPIAWLVVAGIVIVGVATTIEAVQTLIAPLRYDDLEITDMRVIPGDSSGQPLDVSRPEPSASEQATGPTRQVPTDQATMRRPAEHSGGPPPSSFTGQLFFASDDSAIARLKKDLVPADTVFQAGDQTAGNPAMLGAYPMLDLLLRNPNPTPRLITRLRYSARRIDYDDRFNMVCSPLAPTWVYHLMLDSESEYQSGEVVLSQVIEPQSADRFVIVVGHEGRALEATYSLTVELMYDGNRSAALPPVHIPIMRQACESGPQLTRPLRVRR